MKKKILLHIALIIIISNLLPDTLALEYRNPLQLITWTTGIVLDDAGNGRQTALYTDSYYNYIAYKPGLEPGTEVLTVFIYNPITLYSDDFIGRYDFLKKF